MAEEIVMPRLSDSMEEGTILKWLKSVGDEVAVGDELVEIETDKANMVYEADAAGTLIEVVADEGDTLPIGEVIARVGEEGEAPSGNGAKAEKSEPGARAASPSKPEQSRRPRPSAEAPAATAEQTAGADWGWEGEGESDREADREREGARSGGASGLGPGRADHQGRRREGGRGRAGGGRGRAELPTAAAGPTPGAREKPETAKGEVEQVELTQAPADRRPPDGGVEGDRAALLSRGRDRHEPLRRGPGGAQGSRRRGRRRARRSTTWSSRRARSPCASSRAPTAPTATASSSSTRAINVGVAVAARDALVVPTIFDADRKGLRQIATEARALAGRVREGTITPPELSGGTFTVSNLGMYGITNFSAVINPPQAAILAVGAIEERPVVRDGEITTAHLMGVTLACDHRILYGADGAEFLGRVRALLEEPLGLAL